MSENNGHKKRTGRPKLDINSDLFEELCKIQCTLAEIVSVLRISEDTLERWVKRTYSGRTFAEVFAEKREGGKSSLRRSQFKAALDGNPTMLIWLGKQYLQQRDKQEISGPDGGPIEHSFKDERDAAAYLLKSYVDQGLSEIEARTKLVESGMVDPADLPTVDR